MGIFSKKHTIDTDPILNVKNTKANKFDKKVDLVEVTDFLEKIV